MSYGAAMPRERNPFTPNASTASSIQPSAQLKAQNGSARLAKLTFRSGVRVHKVG
jgi:hypothetical protein